MSKSFSRSDLDTTNGSVYVFNCYNEAASGFSVGGVNAGGIPGWATKTTPQPYQPSVLAVPRIKHADDRLPNVAAFANGDIGAENPCIISWNSFTASLTNVHIPGPQDPVRPVQVGDDLILYICWNTAFLMDTKGFVIQSYKYVGQPNG